MRSAPAVRPVRKMGAALRGCNRAPAPALLQPFPGLSGNVRASEAGVLGSTASMTREISFPRTRHLALFEGGQAAEAKAAGSEATLVPIRAAADAAPAVALVDPETPEGALPAAAGPERLAVGVQKAAAQPRELPEVVCVDVSQASGDQDECRALDGSPAGVRCASSLEGRQAAGDAATRAALSGEAVLLAGLDRWYLLGPEKAGYCRSCEMALMEHVRESYGDQVMPFDVLDALRASALPPRERPFSGAKEALRFSEAVEATKRAVLRGRDEARRARSVESAVLGRVGPLCGLSVELCKHLDGLVFELESLQPLAELFSFLAARAALGQRPAVALLSKEATPAQVRQLAAVAAACDCDVLLPQGASADSVAALAAHRAFLTLVRERYRPTAPLVDAEVLFSPRCDHWTLGAHRRSAALAVEALARAQLQPAVRLDLTGGPRTNLLILAGCAALSPGDAAAARRHVESGGDLLLLGRASVADDEGRAGEVLFPEVKSGLDRSGEGRVYALEDAAQLPRALRELGPRPQLTLAGRGKLWARAYLDPERKLDLHLVNLELREDGSFAPAQGVQVQIAGQAAGGGRSGYWFAPERAGGMDGERIPLSPSGFSVSTILPSVDAYALLAVPR